MKMDIREDKFDVTERGRIQSLYCALEMLLNFTLGFDGSPKTEGFLAAQAGIFTAKYYRNKEKEER